MRVSARNGAERLRLPRQVKRLLLRALNDGKLSPRQVRDLTRYRNKLAVTYQEQTR